MTDQISVLLVDDDERVREAYATMLTSFGYVVRTAENGIEALRRLREQIPRIVISDLEMPEMSGFELLSVIRRRFSSIKVVAMSGAFHESSVPLGLNADAFFPKGKSSPEILLGNLKAVLAEERAALSPTEAAALPLWLAKIVYGSESQSIILTCTDCLRPHLHEFSEEHQMTACHAACIFCGSIINYSLVATTFNSSPNPQPPLPSMALASISAASPTTPPLRPASHTTVIH